MAEFGLETVGPNDPNYSQELEAEFNFFLDSQNYMCDVFSMLPEETLGVPVSAESNYNAAIAIFDRAISKCKSRISSRKSTGQLLFRFIQAVSSATAAINIDPNFIRFAQFDEVENPDNNLEDALYERGTFDDFQLCLFNFLS